MLWVLIRKASAKQSVSWTLTLIQGGGGLIPPRAFPPWRWDGWVVRRCWVNFLCRGVLPIWMIIGQGPISLAKGAGGVCLDIFSLVYQFFFSLSLGDGPI